MIKIENLVKKYGVNTAVNNISFEVEQGEIVGFLGPNGAGKSTTMNILTGFLSSTSGKCLINGIDILENPIEAKKYIGYLPEMPPLYPDMTVKEYLNFIFDLKKCDFNRKKHLKEICDVVKITDMQNRLIKNLSKGYRQRVGIAQALVSNPKILIFDEPSVGLDPQQIIEIRNLLKMLGRDHTIILSTHILSEVQAVCNRIVIINKGQIVADQKTEELARVVDSRRKFTIQIDGPKNEVLKFLKNKEGISYAEHLNTLPDGTNNYMFECIKDFDARRSLFFALAQNGWPILSLNALGVNLEDIFIDLTSNKN